jgi:hypothetical protein
MALDAWRWTHGAGRMALDAWRWTHGAGRMIFFFYFLVKRACFVGFHAL